MQREDQTPQILNVHELAQYLHCHPSSIYRMLKRGKIPGWKLGSDWRFNIESIDRWRLGMDPAAYSAERTPDEVRIIAKPDPMDAKALAQALDTMKTGGAVEKRRRG